MHLLPHSRVKSVRTAILSHERILLAVILLAGLLIRLPFALIDFHVGNDLQFFMDWAKTIQAGGLANIYDSPSVNYPPLLLYLFGAAGWTDAQLPVTLQATALVALIKLPSVISDVLTAGLIAMAWWRHSTRGALLATTVYVFNPAVWYVSAYWGQTDSIYALFLVATVVALDRDSPLLAWVIYGLALATKPQSIALAPLLVAWTFVTRMPREWLLAAIGVGIVSITLVLPWLSEGRLGDVTRTFTGLPNQAPKVDVSAYSLWYLLRLGHVHEVSSELHPLGLPVSYQTIGMVVFGMFAAIVSALWIRRRADFLTAATLGLGMYVLLTQMHERYMFPVLALLALACISEPRLWLLYVILSATFFFNLVTIAPFTPLLGTNLVAAQATYPIVSPMVATLGALSLGAAAINVLALAWLVIELARAKKCVESRMMRP